MKVLFSSFSCRPNTGSEFDVGWHWPLLAARDHEVWVLTPKINEPSIQEELARQPIANLHFVFHSLPADASVFEFAGKVHPVLYAAYLSWQASGVVAAKRLHKRIGFDVAQHVTWVSHRFPSLLGWTDIPFVWGPIGGGERAPRRLHASIGRKGALGELARDASNFVTRLDPLVRRTAARASTILTTSAETTQALPRSAIAKARVYPAIGLDLAELEAFDGPPRAPGRRAPRLLFVGRLAAWKGCGLALKALARLHQSGIKAEMTVVGDGPEADALKEMATQLRVAEQVQFHGRLARREVLPLYRQHDVFLFPSLHDSGGIAVLEAMYFGLPVICLDLGGPAQSVGDTGIRVPAESPSQVVRDLAAGIESIISDPMLRERLATTARQRVIETYDWSHKRDTIRDLYRGVVQENRAATLQSELVVGG